MAVAAAAAAAAAATATVTAEAATATVSGNAAGDAVATATATEALHPDAVVGDLLETGVDQLLGDVADHAVHRVRPSVRLVGLRWPAKVSRSCSGSVARACVPHPFYLTYPRALSVPYPCPIRALSLALPRALSRAPSVPHPCPIQWPSRALPPALSSALFVAPCALFVSLTEKGADLVDAALDAARGESSGGRSRSSTWRGAAS